MNKSRVPAIVPEQSESASFVTLVEIHNVDVTAASNRYGSVLSPTVGTQQWPSAIVADVDIQSNRCVGPTIGSSFLVPQFKRQQTTND